MTSAPGPGPEGRIRPTGPGPLVVLGLVGLVLGWASRGQAIRMDEPTPDISWLTIAFTWFFVAVTAGTAYLTRRTVQHARADLTPQQGLARLVLGKTVARLASFALGGFVGLAISNLGVSSDKAGHVITHALLAALGAAAGVAAGLLLEHACRVPPGPDPDLG